jgi:CarboxypepD_reg-like domain/TonB-dependent Receptor Plug Domain
LRYCRVILLFRLSLLTAFLLLPLLSAAQTATVSGQVTDTLGNPAELVQIYCKNTGRGTYTNATGNYSLQIPAGVTDTLYYRGTGYKQQTVVVTPQNGENLVKNIKLNLSTLRTFEKIERAGENGVLLQPKNYTELPSPNADISSILKYAVGVTSNNELSNQYSVRGGSFDENLVYVNDIEIYRPFLTRAGQQEGLSFPNLDMTQSIFFSAGGFEARYGDKMSSVLDVKYKRPTRFRGTATASLLGTNLTLEGSTSRFTWMLGARQKSNRYLLNALDVAGDYNANFTDVQAYLTYDITERWYIDYLGNYAVNKYTLAPQTRETAFGTLNNALKFTVFFAGEENNRFSTVFNAAALNYQRYYNSDQTRYLRWKIIFSSFNTYETEFFDVIGAYRIDQLEADFGKPTFGQVAFNRGVGAFINHARNVLDAYVHTGEVKGWYTTPKHSFMWGGKVGYELIRDELSEWVYVDSADYSIPYNPTTSLDLQDLVKSRALLVSWRFQAYGQYRFSDTLPDSSVFSVNFGVRAHYWTQNGQFVASPRLQLSWSPHWKTDIVFKAAGGIYNQPPFYRELRNYNGALNRNVQAQQSVHALVGADLAFKSWGRPFRFIAETYYKYLDNLVPYDMVDVRLRYYGENLSYGYAYGIDLKLNGEFVRGTESWVNLSLLRTRENLYNDYYNIYLNSEGDTIIPGFTFNNIPTDSIRVEPGFIPRPTDQLLTFSLYFQDYLPKVPDCKMNIGLILGTGLPFGPPTRERYKAVFRYPPYRRVDVGFSYQIIKESKPLKASSPFRHIKSLWAGLEVYNLIQANNTVSYFWVKDVTGRSYAVPNYLTARQISLRMIMHF